MDSCESQVYQFKQLGPSLEVVVLGGAVMRRALAVALALGVWNAQKSESRMMAKGLCEAEAVWPTAQSPRRGTE